MQPETLPEENIVTYLEKDFPGVVVERLKSANPAAYSSFKVTVGEADGPKIMNADLWPSGTRINRFFLARGT